MDIVLVPFLSVVISILGMFQFFLFIYIVLSWLEAFNIINRYNKLVYTVQTFLFQLYEPILRRIRRFMPDLGGIDLSPLVLIFGVYFFQGVLEQLARKIAI